MKTLKIGGMIADNNRRRNSFAFAPSARAIFFIYFCHGVTFRIVRTTFHDVNKINRRTVDIMASEMRKEFNREVRGRFLATVENICVRCGRNHDIFVHHKHALADGGTNDFDNLVCLCGFCHNEWHETFEGNYSFEDFLETPNFYALAGMFASKSNHLDNIELTFGKFKEIIRAAWRSDIKDRNERHDLKYSRK